VKRADDIEAAAALWLIRRDEPDWSDVQDRELKAWLDESYAHKAAYWRLEHGWGKADRITALGPDVLALPPAGRAGWLNPRSLAVAASLAIVLITGVQIVQVGGRKPDSEGMLAQYKTPIGGHERVALADGSMVELNTATVVRAGVSKSQRTVWLDSGEAFFSVAKSTVPFVIHAGPRVVTVVGTKFSVSRQGDKVQVAVVEGKVRVSGADKSASAPEATITRGDVLTAAGNSTLVLQKAAARVERSLAWRNGMLQFDRTPLEQVAQEFNRYNQRKLVITGDARDIPIGGSFQASNVDAFARLLRDAYGLRVETAPNEMRVAS
jgi:transmembrane sensor